jgi:putative salt-induced outer membrane protein YdiY
MAAGAVRAQPIVPRTAADSVREAEDALRDALRARDRDALLEQVSPGFRTGDTPSLDRSAWLDRRLGPCGGTPSAPHDFQVAFVGDTALVSYVVTEMRDAACPPAPVRARVAAVWQWQGVAWRLIMRTAIPDEEPSSRDAAPPSPAAAAGPPRPWVASSELNVLSTRGNVNTLTIGSVADGTWQRGQSRTAGRAAFLRTTSGGRERGRSIDLQLREARTLSPVVELFGRALYQRDLFAGILQRYGGDAGVGLVLVQDGQRLQATIGAGTTREVRLTGPSQSGPVATAGAQYRLALSPSTNLSVDVLATGFLVRRENWRVESTPAITTAFRRPFSLRVSYQTKYINNPVPGFRRFDAILSAGLVARF